MTTDPVTRVIALAAYARAAGCCGPCSLTLGRGLAEGVIPIEQLDAGEPFAIAALRELDRGALRCTSAGHAFRGAR